MTPRKIAVVLPDLRGGGAERLHLNLASAWLREGVEVDFVLLRAHGELMHLLPEAASVVELGVARLRSAAPALRRYLRASEPDATLVAMWPLTCVGVAAWLTSGCPGRLFVSDHTQLSVACLAETSTSIRTLGLSIRLTYPLASGIIAVSKGVRDDLCRLGGLDPRRVHVVHNPAAIDPKTVHGREVDADTLWGRTGGLRILSVGTLKPQKDHATLLRALALLPPVVDARLVVLGDGALRHELTTLAEHLGVSSRVVFQGFVEDPTPWLRTADVFVLSSRWEGFANVIVEALSFGVPVVSTNCPSGPSEILEDGRFGDLVGVADAEGMARAIVRSQGRWSRQLLMDRSKDFSVGMIARQYLRVMGVEE